MALVRTLLSLLSPEESETSIEVESGLMNGGFVGNDV